VYRMILNLLPLTGESGAGVTNPEPAGLPRRTPRRALFISNT